MVQYYALTDEQIQALVALISVADFKGVDARRVADLQTQLERPVSKEDIKEA
jgi:hypothetical protein